MFAQPFLNKFIFITLNISPPLWRLDTASAKPLYKANDELNQQISLFRGDITKLEIDAIANAGEDYALE